MNAKIADNLPRTPAGFKHSGRWLIIKIFLVYVSAFVAPYTYTYVAAAGKLTAWQAQMIEYSTPMI